MSAPASSTSSPDLVILDADLFGRRVDVLVAQGRIQGVRDHDPQRPEADDGPAERLAAGGLTLLPSLIDAHVHLREPGFEYKEDVASGLGAAAYGGFGRVLAMANTRPVADEAAVVEQVLDAGRRAWPNGPYVLPVGGLTKGLAGTELSQMADLANAGCVAVSNDGLPVANSEIFRRALEYATTVGLTVIDHCEDPHLAPGAGVNEGSVSSRLGLKAQPWIAEAAQVARDILMAEYLGIPIHLAHISCIGSLELIRASKARGVAVSAETCPHYLFLTEEAVAGYNTAAKVNPPLRTEADVQAMRQAITDGTIDILATDHAPHAAYEKEVEFMEAPCGISGLDTALALTWDLVRAGQIDGREFCALWCWRPAEIFGLPACRFQPGDPADLVLFDPEESWTVTPQAMRSKGKNTPLLGRELRGRVKAHYLGGIRVA